MFDCVQWCQPAKLTIILTWTWTLTLTDSPSSFITSVQGQVFSTPNASVLSITTNGWLSPLSDKDLPGADAQQKCFTSMASA
jgi:hypothetical protein